MYPKHPWMIGGKPSQLILSPWSRLQDKLFEQALVLYPDDTPDRWEKIACGVPGKTAWEVGEHYDALIADVMEIDSGRVQLPSYADNSLPSWELESRTSAQISFGFTKTKQSDAERKKGVPWTEEEHKLFLIGLKKYGKGDWRSISRNAVQSGTPTQVASHAQKYYLRLNSEKKERKRSSIHDITTVENNNSFPQLNSQEQYRQPNVLDQQVTTGSYPGPRGGYPAYQHQFNFLI